MLLGIPATVLLLIQAVTADDSLLPYSSAFEALLYFYAAGAATNPDEPRTWMEQLFLSFTTLSSTGLSDVVPIRPRNDAKPK